MFLFAKVVLDNLAEQSSPADLRVEMRPDVFPHKLEEAYNIPGKGSLINC
jgi:hypothetical protein